jgi:hypothetical protein
LRHCAPENADRDARNTEDDRPRDGKLCRLRESAEQLVERRGDVRRCRSHAAVNLGVEQRRGQGALERRGVIRLLRERRQDAR